MNRYVKYALLWTVVLLLVGCLKPIATPTVSTYSLGNALPVSSTKTKTPLILMVAQPVANPGFNSANMVYVNIPLNLKTYANNQWVAPPSEMMLPLLAQALSAPHYFHAVVIAPYAGLADYRLDTRLIALQQEFLRPTSQVRLIMQAFLVSNQTNTVVASQRFQAVVTAPGNNPYSGVLAAHQATRMVCNKIAHFVLAAIKKAPKSHQR